jgi:hypothetical protein
MTTSDPTATPQAPDEHSGALLIAGTTCNTCGTPNTATHPHYRLPRVNRGNTDPHNTIQVCDGCTYRAKTLTGEQLGWTVRRGNDPATIPYFRLSDQLWRQWDGDAFVVINSTLAVELQVAFGQIGDGMAA